MSGLGPHLVCGLRLARRWGRGWSTVQCGKGVPAVIRTQGRPARLNAPLRACAPPCLSHLDVEVGRVEAAGRDKPCLGCPQVLGHQLSGSLHQELTVALGRHHPGDKRFRQRLPRLHQPPPPVPRERPLRMPGGQPTTWRSVSLESTGNSGEVDCQCSD